MRFKMCLAYPPRQKIKKQAVLLFSLFFINSSALAYELGGAGLITVPDAFVAGDGAFGTSISKGTNRDIYAMNFQATPWLETTFRYSVWQKFRYFDRSYGIKAQIIGDNYDAWYPAIAVGLTDVLGTGKFGSEYVVASKRYGNLSISSGIGWGRLAGDSRLENPLKQISNRFKSRSRKVGQGGKLASSSFFGGEKVGFFGGLKYQVSGSRWSILADYNSDPYEFSQRRVGYQPDSPMSYGVTYEVSDGVSLGLSSKHGDTVAITFSSKIGLSRIPNIKRTNAKINNNDYEKLKSNETSKQVFQQNVTLEDSWVFQVYRNLNREGVSVRSFSISEDKTFIILEIENRKFLMWSDAILVLVDNLERYAPSDMNTVKANLVENGHIVSSISFDLGGSSSGLATDEVKPDIFVDNVPIKKEKISIDQQTVPIVDSEGAHKFYDMRRHKSFFHELGLGNRLQLMDPDEPLRYQITAQSRMRYDFDDHNRLNFGFSGNLLNNFDTIKRKSNSVLPHVRSDISEYLKGARNGGLEYLYFENRHSGHGSMHHRYFFGVLEQMYNGFGYETLFRMPASRFGLGASFARVYQRDTNLQSIAHRGYNTNIGFLNFFWATPFYDFDLGVHYGRYLAKDTGQTLELLRSFDNGAAIGAWATFTNVPAKKFGEGSFDKGIKFKVPLELIFGSKTRARYQTQIRSMQRDGGQRIEGFNWALWDDLRSSRADAIYNGWRR